MSDAESTADAPADASDSDESLEIEGEFRQARHAAGLDPSEIGFVQAGQPAGALLSPYLVLYAGFFLGPGLAFLASLLVGPRVLSVRRVSVMLGICGATWCALQGTTMVVAGAWSDVGVQVIRSLLNFGGSALLIMFWRRESPGHFVHDRSAISRSIAAGVVLLAFFSILPPDVLAYLGR